MRFGRVVVVLPLAGAALALASSALAVPSVLLSAAFTVKKTIAVPLPDEGDALLASVVLTGKVKAGGGTLGLPKVRVANAGSLPASVSVAGSAVRLEGKKNRFLLAIVVLNRQSAGVGRALDRPPIVQVEIEVRFIQAGDTFVRDIGVNLTFAQNVLATSSVLPATVCTRLLNDDVSQPARWLVGPPDPGAGVVVNVGVVLEIAPKVVCRGDEEARLELEILVGKQPLPTTDCSGTFLPFDATEVSFQVRCPALGSGQATGFDVQLPGSRQIMAFLSPTGFTCAVTTRSTTKDTLSCAVTIAPGSTYTGNIRMSPGPTAGMGGTLYVFENGAQVGPFAMTGP